MFSSKQGVLKDILNQLKPNVYGPSNPIWIRLENALNKLSKKDLEDLHVAIRCIWK